MQLEQVNALLLEKVNLQSEGIGQREKMLQRERDWGCVQWCVKNPALKVGNSGTSALRLLAKIFPRTSNHVC